MKEIVVITPFLYMADLVQRIAVENAYDNVCFLPSESSVICEDARRVINDGARVIISRGGCYEIIKNAFDIPIVEIKVTAFDLIEAFESVRKIKLDGVVGVFGYKNVIYGAEMIASVMGLETVCCEITNPDNIISDVENMIGRGIRIFVGDSSVNIALSRANCHVFPVHSGVQAMQIAIAQAQEILHASRLQKEKAQQFTTIIDFVHDGIIAVDKHGIVTVFNSASEKITGVSRQKAIGRAIGEIIPGTRLTNVLESGHSEIGDIQQLGNQAVIATSRIPVIVDGKVRGAVATYQDITDVQKIEQKIRARLAEKGFFAEYDFSDIVHKSSIMERSINTARKFAQYDSTVLILGASGVGKEMFAQSIHNNSRRKNSPFVAINCAALPETLIESELFGYAEGSFTGASRKGKPGLFEMAHGGTILLDEISELPLILQGRLLRVLQEKQVMRIGDNKLIPVDVRIICATNRNLREQVKAKLFRSDLYFRIAILCLYIPALSERGEDIELLSEHFVKEFSKRYRKGVLSLSQESRDYLRHYDFQGNVRELSGMVERAVIVCDEKTLSIHDFSINPHGTAGFGEERADSQAGVFSEGITLKALEERYIEHVFKKTDGSLKKSSALLGIGRTTLWRKIRENPGLQGQMPDFVEDE